MKKPIYNCLTGSTLLFFLSIVFISSLNAQNPLELEPKPEHFIFYEFVNGSAVLKNGDVIDALFNYNFLNEEMIFDHNGTKKAIGKLDNIDTVYLENHKFIPVGNVFYELAIDAPLALFIQHRGKLNSKGTPAGYGGTSQLSSSRVTTTLVNSGKVQELSSPGEYDYINTTLFWIRTGDVFYRANNLRNVQKILPEKSKEIKEFINRRNTNFESISEMLILAGYLNTLNIQPGDK